MTNDFLKPLIFYPHRQFIVMRTIIISLAYLFFLVFTGISINRVAPRFVDYLVGSVFVLYFGYLAFYFWSYCLTKLTKSALKINEKGIIDNTIFSNVGFIPWEQIDCIFVYPMELKSG
ncbi:MAG: hypothetical protein F6K03_16450, partial [Kamptonema sp. SIO4C4]|nr:hypothetical protein [Kamptonema sp. SIO4C4]